MDERLRGPAFFSRLAAALAQVAPEDRTPPAGARVGAVLVLLEDTDDGPQVVLTRRRRDMRSHPGQVSFAGGRLDAGESPREAALREAQEEIDLDPASVEVIGTGSVFYIPPSRFWVVPVVARWRRPHALRENPWEVDEVLRLPVSHLLERHRWRHAPMTVRGSSWAWQLDDDVLWGATAMVLAQVLDDAVAGWDQGLAPADLPERLAVRPWEEGPSWQRRVRLEGELPSRPQGTVPHVGRAAVRRVRAWLDRHGIDGLARAEHGGRATAQAVRRLLGDSLAGRRVTLLCGPSSNGAAGLAGARLLTAAGAEVDVLTVGAVRYPAQTHALRAAGVRIAAVPVEGLTDARSPGEVVVDALLGVGAEPPLRGLAAEAARWLRRHDVPVVALDLPSGVSADHGLTGACVGADVTVAFGLPVAGLGSPIVHAYLGDVYLADLGIPPAAWRAAGVADIDPALFAHGPLLRLTDEDADGS